MNINLVTYNPTVSGSDPAEGQVAYKPIRTTDDERAELFHDHGHLVAALANCAPAAARQYLQLAGQD